MAETSGKKGIGVALLVVGGVIALVCCGAGGYIALQVKDVADTPKEEMAQMLAEKMGIDVSAEDARTESFLIALREHRFEDASAMTTEAFQLSTGPDGLATLQERTESVMGAYRSKYLASFNVNQNTVNGVKVATSDVTYTGSFELGEGTITVRLVERSQGEHEIESFQVNSPRFTDAR